MTGASNGYLPGQVIEMTKPDGARADSRIRMFRPLAELVADPLPRPNLSRDQVSQGRRGRNVAPPATAFLATLLDELRESLEIAFDAA
ncbi:hypothetical protein Ssi02_47770 [Sinosporangium siamense]|uniref:Uncharacterized protein n=1 Tax=Sinosporangium siamense TaxID=1367973 RepID=A0A919V8S3_9ACTN|nr:hypothetical protein Ssi02_47770 [Sinosporangium siamense]